MIAVGASGAVSAIRALEAVGDGRAESARA